MYNIINMCLGAVQSADMIPAQPDRSDTRGAAMHTDGFLHASVLFGMTFFCLLYKIYISRSFSYEKQKSYYSGGVGALRRSLNCFKFFLQSTNLPSEEM